MRYWLGLVLAFVFLGLALNTPTPEADDDVPVLISRKAPAQQKSAHMLVFLNGSGDEVSGCSGTAIGPHAILTADHCNDNDRLTDLHVDLSTNIYHIVDKSHDSRDHVIYLLDGPAFKNIDPYVTARPVVHEAIYICGFGGGKYPVSVKEGKVMESYDPSDVNEDQQIVYYKIKKAIPGDSGAAIYDANGAILGLVTYGINGEVAGFELNFTPSDLEIARNFQYDNSKS